ncbi:mechanosensitive ion channel family protein [Virgibacillus alimentarius]|uniref:Small conductance mechanosensitive channel n=1 Tax=Virgibacillus alimentarius TaxID=698769 RepID=A0ABS4S6D1_9BACI|nr:MULTISPECIES: mechanosensitive ion channel family protein [Virgibacillus]MBP2257054.1 small conductance mechanosensitive channel [Virgibacillus alimentarius]HLR68766.1 mechanosensitive ion channel family protein [Virgibacillus sp.]
MGAVNNQFMKLWDYITGPELWATLSKGFIKIVIIIILAKLVIKIGKKITEQIFQSKQRGPIRITARREATLKKLIQNMISYIIYFMALVMILDTLTIKIGPLLAGAGVAGLAIGFGAQNLVRDIISGFFIIFEDQFSVGDYVFTSGVEGTVEEIGLRTTKIQSWTGEQNVIPNGSITQVTNYSIHNGLAVVDINIPYESDIETAEKVIERVVGELPDKYEEIVTIPEILGVQTLELSHYVIRVVAETLPVYQWAGARMIRKEVKEALYNEGIEIPSPRLVMYSRNENATGLEMEREREQ